MFNSYVIRWDRKETFGSDFDLVSEDGRDRYLFLKNVRISPGGRDAIFIHLESLAISFGSWAEAAAVASFIICHIDDMYEDALEIVKIEE